MSGVRQSPIRDLLAEAGASFATIRGSEVAVQFSGVEPECRAARSSTVVWDRTDRGFLMVAGNDAPRFLHGMCTNEIQGLAPGSGHYACHLDTQGHILADFHALRMEDHFLLETDASLVEPLRTSLDHYVIADDVELSDFTDKLAVLSVEGPGAGALLRDAASSELPEADFQHGWKEVGGVPALVVRLSETGEAGFRVITTQERMTAIWERLCDASQKLPWKPAGSQALNTLRTEAGLPRYPEELTAATLPPEARLEQRAISYTKGCYMGQEIIERIRSRGSVNRLLCGLVLQAGELPSTGTQLRTEGKEAGWITTAVHSPLLGLDVGLGYVRRNHTEPGTTLEIETGGTAEVTELPFHKPRT